MNKRIISFALAIIILLGSSGFAFAMTSEDMKVQYLIDNKIIEGRTTDEEGVVDYALDKTLTRAEVTKLIVYILNLQELAESIKGSILAFSDVDNNHWANGYISVATTKNENIAYGRRIILGYPDGKFLPEKDINYNEMAAMLVRIVKLDLTELMEMESIWATSYLNWAKELGLLKGINIENSNKPINRKDAFIMVYNALEIRNETNKNNPDFQEVMGIVSKFQGGIIELNQDKDKQYKFTQNTRTTDGTTYGDLRENIVTPGSLVRLIADENKNVNYIIELGNPKDLAIPGRWFDVAEKTVSSTKDIKILNNYTESNTVVVGDIEAEITVDTRIFAADLDKNALREVKALAEIFDIYAKRRKPIKDVYMGYDEYFGTHREAKVIVFGDIEKFQGKEEMRRIVTPVNSKFQFSAQSMIGGLTKVFTLEDVGHFPTEYKFGYNDVVLMYFDDYENSRVKLNPQVLIDYSEDDVYEIAKIDHNMIVIRDKDGYEFPFDMTTSAKFLTDEVVEGAHVQILWTPPQFIIDIIGKDNITDMKNIDIEEILKGIDVKEAIEIIKEINSISDFNFLVMAISVVEDDLRGNLPIGIRTGTETGYIDSIAGDSVTVVDKIDGVKRNHRSYNVAATDIKMAKIANLLDFEVVFDIAYKYGRTEYIYNIQYYFDHSRLYGSPMDNWIFQTLYTSLKMEWNKQKLEESYGMFNYIMESDNKYPILFLSDEIVLIAVESYNSANDMYGGPGRLSIPPGYFENWNK